MCTGGVAAWTQAELLTLEVAFGLSVSSEKDRSERQVVDLCESEACLEETCLNSFVNSELIGTCVGSVVKKKQSFH